MSNKKNKNKKPGLGKLLAFAWILILVFFNFFAKSFPHPSSQKGISYNPPSSGYNDLYIYNQYDDDNQVVEADSLELQLLDTNGESIKKMPLWKADHTVSVSSNQIEGVSFFLPVDSISVSEYTPEAKLILYGLEDRNADTEKFNRYISFNNKTFYTMKYDVENQYHFCYTNSVNLTGSSCVPAVLKGKSLLGTDPEGRSLALLIIYGTGYVVRIIFFSLLISLILALPIAFYRGFFDNWLSNVLDAFVNFINSIPIYYIIILIAVLFDYELVPIIIAIAVVQWIEMEKIIYNQVCKIKKADFIKSARMIGKSSFAIIFTEILPLCWDQITISAFFLAKRIVLIEATLSYLGFSASVSDIGSWGKIISSVDDILTYPYARYIVVFPLLMIIFTLVSLNSMEKFFRNRKKYA